MKIADVQIVPFRWKVDRYRNATPLPQTEVVQTVLTIVSNEKPALGYDVVWEYIEEHRVRESG